MDHDPNLDVPGKLERTDIDWYDAKCAPITLYGLDHVGDGFRRLPEDFPILKTFGGHGAGIRARFVTDSPWIAIRAVFGSSMPHSIFSDTAVMAFDLYRKTDGGEVFHSTFRVPAGAMERGYESLVSATGERTEYTINFPNFTCVKQLWIGVKTGASVTPDGGYNLGNLPIVFYGSSITHGAGSSRAGMAYPAMIGQRLFVNHRNLGFAGSAKGEPVMAEYIAAQKMAAFVLDYDHNASTAEHLASTHYAFYRTVRDAQPDLPIIIVSAPIVGRISPLFAAKREIILETVRRAGEAGDTHVTFVDGMHLFDGPFADACTIENTHPNDLGFYRMATVIGTAVAGALDRRF